MPILVKIVSVVGKLMFLFKRKRLSEPKNLLVIRSGAIGDVLMTTPFLAAIRNRFPKAKITYLVGNWSKEILEKNPDVDKVITFDDKIVSRKKLFPFFKLIKDIKKNNFDLAFVMDKSFLWSLFAFFAGIKFRIGFDRLGEGFANNKNVFYDGTKNEVDYNMQLAKLVGGKAKDDLQLFLTKKDEKFANDFVKKKISRQMIGIAPGGAENPGQKMHVKRWSREKYAELAEKISKKYDFLFFGGPSDKEVVKDIMKRVESKNLYDLSGKTTLKQSAALIRKCKYFITHDSGLMHVAASTGVKLIAVFGPTDPKRFAPKGAVVVKTRLKGCPCYDVYGSFKRCETKKCMDFVGVGDIIREIKS